MAAAERVLRDKRLRHGWASTPGVFDRRVQANFCALRLIWEVDRAVLDRVPDSLVARWTTTVLTFPAWRGEGSREAAALLACYLWSRIPSAVLESLASTATPDRNSDEFGLERLAGCWDERLTDFCDERIRLPSYDRQAFQVFIGALVRHAPERARSAATLFVTGSEEARYPGQLADVAAAMVDLGGDKAIEDLSTIADMDEDAVRNAFLGFTHNRSDGNKEFLLTLTEPKIGELFRLLARLFPIEDDVVVEGAHFVSPRESLGRLRSEIVTHLRDIGSRSAVDELRKIVADLPSEAEWLGRTILAAEHQVIAQEWIPLPPSEVLEFQSGSTPAVVIQSGPNLLDVVVESLDRFARVLRGETPAVEDLWYPTDGGLRPRNETALSNMVKRHLEARSRESSRRSQPRS